MTHEAIATEAISTWLCAAIGHLEAPFTFQRLAGGHSNLTFVVTDSAGRQLVLRRPPTGPLLPSAHDMSREYRVQQALRPAGIPVPPTLAFCDDSAVTGAPFYAMGFVPGRVMHTPEDVAAFLDPAARRTAGLSLVEIAAALHEVEPEAVGLADFGRAEGYVTRQLRRWYEQFRNSGGATPQIDNLHDVLTKRVPQQQRVSVVHGDYRLGNCILHPSGTVAAVLDWEISTLGDALADLGYLLATWAEAGDTFRTISTSPSDTGGFLSRAELAAHYATHSTLDLSDLPFYLAFSYWKQAWINQGVWARYDSGQQSAEGVNVGAIRSAVDQLASAAGDALVGS